MRFSSVSPCPVERSTSGEHRSSRFVSLPTISSHVAVVGVCLDLGQLAFTALVPATLWFACRATHRIASSLSTTWFVLPSHSTKAASQDRNPRGRARRNLRPAHQFFPPRRRGELLSRIERHAATPLTPPESSPLPAILPPLHPFLIAPHAFEARVRRRTTGDEGKHVELIAKRSRKRYELFEWHKQAIGDGDDSDWIW